MGKENWMAADGTKRNSVYYWETKEALRQFSQHPQHVEAKQQYQKWYGGFHVFISEVIKSYGDDAFENVTPNSRSKAPRKTT